MSASYLKNITVERVQVYSEVFYTSDGEKHFSRSMAEYTEKHLWIRNIEKDIVTMKLDIPSNAGFSIAKEWFMYSRPEQFEYYLDKFCSNHSFHINNKYYDSSSAPSNRILKLGEWISPIVSYDEEGSSNFSGFVTLSYIYEKMQEFIKRVDEITVEGKF